MFEVKEGYEVLAGILSEALDRAQVGKGAERHGSSGKWEDQPGPTDAIKIGPAGPIFQVRKKALEALRLQPQSAYNEMLDCAVYSAMAAYAIRARYESES